MVRRHRVASLQKPASSGFDFRTGMVTEIALTLLRQGLQEGIERLDEFLHALML
jgi:hypothetical protein